MSQSLAVMNNSEKFQQREGITDVRWQRADALALLLFVGAAWIAVRGLWNPGVPNNGDFLLGIYRVFELNSAWQNGVLFPRFGPDLNFGYGAPLFQYYPPLVTYLILGFHALGSGYLNAAKLVLSLNIIGGGIGVYFYLRWLTGRSWAALCGATLYLCAPYILLVAYERGAAAESLALALLPWLFWLIHRQLYSADLLTVGLAAVMVALTMLAHNITALFAIPAVVLYATLLGLYARRWQPLMRVALAIGLGLGVSAFYWIPALVELGYSRAESIMLTDEASVTAWLLTPARLLQDSLVVFYGGEERFRFSLWFALLGLAVLGGGRLYDRQWGFNLGLLVSVWLAVILLQLEATQIFWTQLPLVRFVQFPWRLYGLGALCLSLAVGLLVASAQVRTVPRQIYGAVGTMLLLLTIFFATYNLRVQTLPLWRVIPEAQIGRADLFEKGRYKDALSTDYTPIWMQRWGATISLPRAADERLFAPSPEMPIVQLVRETANAIEVDVTATVPFDLRYHKIFFPGWTVEVDGAAVPTTASGSLGLVTAQIPAGMHRVRVAFQQTPVRWLSDRISWSSLAFLLGGVLLGLKGRRRLIFLLIALMIGVPLYFYSTQLRANAARHPTPYMANLADTLQLLAYDFNQTTLPRGESLPVRFYWFVRSTPTKNLKLFIHLMPLDSEERVSQLDQEPLFGYNPTTRWESGELIVDNYELPIPAELVPGTYRVAVGIYDPETVQNLPVRAGPNTLPGDRMLLTTIEIQ